jgi:hypothetical protein
MDCLVKREYILETKLFLIMKILRLDINKYLCCQQNHLSRKQICSIVRNILLPSNCYLELRLEKDCFKDASN